MTDNNHNPDAESPENLPLARRVTPPPADDNRSPNGAHSPEQFTPSLPQPIPVSNPVNNAPPPAEEMPETVMKVTPMRSPEPDRHRNLFDDMTVAFTEMKIYKFMIFLAMAQSNNVILFLRYDIGLRVLQSWTLQVAFFFLLFVSGFGGTLLSPFRPWQLDGWLFTYALFMGLLAWVHVDIARELAEHDDRRHPLGLHTRARGDSFLTPLLGAFPSVGFPWWNWYERGFKKLRLLPLDEPTIQGVVEPCIVLGVGTLALKSGAYFLGLWLILSALCLRIVEYDVFAQAMHATHDMRDARIEAQTLRANEDIASGKRNPPPKGKIGGIAVASPLVLKMRAQRQGLQAGEDGQGMTA